MTTLTTPAPATRTASIVRAGQVVSALVVAFLLLDAVLHIVKVAPVVDGAKALGFDPALMPLIGALELVLVGLYLVRRTSVLGAVLLTGYLGGALCAQLRIDAPVFSTLLFPVYVGVALWAGLYVRDARVRSMIAPR